MPSEFRARWRGESTQIRSDQCKKLKLCPCCHGQCPERPRPELQHNRSPVQQLRLARALRNATVRASMVKMKPASSPRAATRHPAKARCRAEARRVQSMVKMKPATSWDHSVISGRFTLVGGLRRVGRSAARGIYSGGRSAARWAVSGASKEITDRRTNGNATFTEQCESCDCLRRQEQQDQISGARPQGCGATFAQRCGATFGMRSGAGVSAGDAQGGYERTSTLHAATTTRVLGTLTRTFLTGSRRRRGLRYARHGLPRTTQSGGVFKP